MSDTLYDNLKTAAAIVGVIAVVHVAANAFPLFEIAKPAPLAAPVADSPTGAPPTAVPLGATAVAPPAAPSTVNCPQIVVVPAGHWVQTECNAPPKPAKKRSSGCR